MISGEGFLYRGSFDPKKFETRLQKVWPDFFLLHEEEGILDYFKNEEAYDAWEEGGMTEANKEHLITVLPTSKGFTIVTEDCPSWKSLKALMGSWKEVSCLGS
jgi:hypothetical protein